MTWIRVLLVLVMLVLFSGGCAEVVGVAVGIPLRSYVNKKCEDAEFRAEHYILCNGYSASSDAPADKK